MRGKRKSSYHEVFSLIKFYFYDQYVPDSALVDRIVWHNVKGLLVLGRKIIEEELTKIEKTGGTE